MGKNLGIDRDTARRILKQYIEDGGITQLRADEITTAVGVYIAEAQEKQKKRLRKKRQQYRKDRR